LPSAVSGSLEFVSPTSSPRGAVRSLLSAMRVPQWVKNCLLGIAPAASGTLWHRHVLLNTVVAFVAFCLIASSLYILNDLKDVESDRAHPTKRFRSIAAGDLSPASARVAALLLAAIGFAVPVAINHPAGFYLILTLYVTETLVYIYWLKNAVIIEMGLVASGFFLRSYGGAVASHIPVSTWFLIVVTFGALFLVVGKRAAELRHVGSTNRAVLSHYTSDFLHSALTLSATVVVTAYCLWAIDTSSTGLSSVKHDVVLVRLSMVPVVLAILFIIRGAESDSGESPEDLLLKNRTVQALALIWIVLVAWGTYL
jgi:decaprenyl-phosphate phosphoribosyltransferase